MYPYRPCCSPSISINSSRLPFDTEEFCCSRLHYVSHRLALGEDGLRDLIAAECKILGHSVFANSSNLAALAVPVMDWEEGTQTNSAANHILQNDPVVLKHVQVGASHAQSHRGIVYGKAWCCLHMGKLVTYVTSQRSDVQNMEATIETMRAEKLAQVVRMDCSTLYTRRRQCLQNMQERAMMADSCLQDTLFAGINKTDDICAKNPGCEELEKAFSCKMRGASLPTSCVRTFKAAPLTLSQFCTPEHLYCQDSSL
jgi:hypothetical protein